MVSINKELTTLKNDAYEIIKDKEKPKKKEAAKSFFKDAKYAVSLIFQEKEIIFFALLQLVSIMAGYLLWVLVLDLIPEEVWQSLDSSDEGTSPADLIVFAWSFICVGLVTYPLGIFTACMGAAHFLHRQGQESTVLKCLNIVMANSGRIWTFSWIDGWWTITRILERLPKKNDRTPLATKLIKEAIYQAWKLATLGVLPAFIIGRGTVDACKDSLGLLKDKFSELIKLRLGYSFICWVFGIGSYVLMIVIFPFAKDYMRSDNDMYTFYLFAGIPILFALIFIQLIFRPIYIISACNIYSDYILDNNIEVDLAPNKKSASFILFIILVIAMVFGYAYRDELGITKMLETPFTSTSNP